MHLNAIASCNAFEMQLREFQRAIERANFNAQLQWNCNGISTREFQWHFNAQLQLQRREGISTRNFNGAAAFRRVIETARRHFDAQFQRRGGITTRNLNRAAPFRRAI
jgi:hypothetical protein